MTQNGASNTSPFAEVTVQRAVARSKAAETTRVSVWMNCLKPSRSAT
jgi:hypothetical protein